MSNLFIDKYPLILLPSLAVKVGLNEAIILQQIHYGHIWVKASFSLWQEENFPFWHINTIKKAMTSLRKAEIVISMEDPTTHGFDRTSLYRIDYEKLEGLYEEEPPRQECTTDGTDIVPFIAQELDQGKYTDCTLSYETNKETIKRLEGEYPLAEKPKKNLLVN